MQLLKETATRPTAETARATETIASPPLALIDIVAMPPAGELFVREKAMKIAYPIWVGVVAAFFASGVGAQTSALDFTPGVETFLAQAFK